MGSDQERTRIPEAEYERRAWVITGGLIAAVAAVCFVGLAISVINRWP